MDKKLHIKLFRFNHKTDYLPYYTSFTITCKETDSVIELLAQLSQIEEFSYAGVEKFGIKVNNLFTKTDVKLSELLNKFSNEELTIEPVSTYRAIHDLTISTEDYFNKLELLKKYLSKEDFNNYAFSLQLDYYASNTLNFNRDYIGDHVLLIASELISKKPEYEQEIIELISDKNNGVWFHTSVEKRMLNPDKEKQTKIKTLVEKITNSSLNEELSTIPKTVKVDQEFIGFNIAAYDTTNTCEMKNIVEQSKASFISTESQNDDLALYSTEADKNFSYKIAGKVLLDALDNNADFILVNDKKNFFLFDNKQKEIESAVGRDINLPIVTTEQFNQLLSGEKDPIKLGFQKHKVAVSFL